MRRSEYGGDSAGWTRPDGSTRRVGQPLGLVGHLSASDQMRMAKLTGDPTGATPIPENGRPWNGQTLEPTGAERAVADLMGREGGVEEARGRLVVVVGPEGPPGPVGPGNLFVQENEPAFESPGLWVETRPDGTVKSLWAKTD